MKVRLVLSSVLILVVILAGWLSVCPSLAQSEGFTEVSALRTQTSKTYLSTNGTYRYITTGKPLHYIVNSTWQNIDNSWLPAGAPWNWRMTGDSYQAYALSNFAAGQSLMFVYNGSSVAYQPMAIEWTNNLSQISQISMPQNVPITINNTPQEPMPNTSTFTGTIRWDDAYGEGRHFEWNANPGRLKETIQLDSLPPQPPQYIIDGGSPVLRHNFIFSPSSDLEIWVNGILWDKKTTVLSTNRIEFRKSGKVLWVFEAACYWDSNYTNSLKLPTRYVALTELRKAGNNLYISTRIPYEWFQTAVYPVFIDPQKTFQPSDGEDNYLQTSTATTNYGTSTDLVVGHTSDAPHSAYRGILEFTVNWATDFPATYTVTSAVFSLYFYSYTAVATTAMRMLRLDWEEGASTWTNYKTATAWTTAGCGSDGNDFTSTDSVSVTMASGWTSWTITNQVAWAKTNTANVGLRVRVTSETVENFGVAYSSDSGTAAYRPKLVVDYIIPPAIHTDDATSVLSTTATINGEITDDGGNTNNVTVTMFWGDNDGGTTPGSWDNSAAPTSPAQPQGAAVFYKDVTSLNASTLYYFSANGTNLAGTTWATTKNFTTESACSPSILLNVSSWIVNGGSPVVADSSYSTGIAYFRITNNSGGTVNITIGGTDMVGGNSWDLADNGSPGNMIYGMYAGLDDADDLYDIVVREMETYNLLVGNLADAATQDFGLKFWTPTVFTDGVAKSGNITLTTACI